MRGCWSEGGAVEAAAERSGSESVPVCSRGVFAMVMFLLGCGLRQLYGRDDGSVGARSTARARMECALSPKWKGLEKKRAEKDAAFRALNAGRQPVGGREKSRSEARLMRRAIGG